jgi:L-asparaginase
MKIRFIAVGGTIDKIYFDKMSTYQVGESAIGQMLRDANVTFEYSCESMIHKDSLDMDDKDRQEIYDAIEADENRFIIVTHGTDTMIQTARKLKGISNKVIVLTGAMVPARFKDSDAPFNIGFAVAAVQSLAPGVYIAMNGRIFDPGKVRKNRDLNRFEEL